MIVLLTFLFRSSVCVHVSTVPLKKKKTYSFSDRSLALTFLSLSSFPPSCAFLSSLSVRAPSPLPLSFSPSLPPPPSSPHRPCWIGGVNTGRERALFHHARAGAGRSCRAPAPGSKVYCGFHFTFPQPITAPHCRA